MLIRDEYLTILAELGLTYTQARIYITLISLGNATASKIGKHSNIARQDVYRILSELESKGLIEKSLAKPASFRPIALNCAISILLQKKEEEIHNLKTKAIKHLKNLEADCVNPVSLDDQHHFKILSKHHINPSSTVYKIGTAVAKAEKSVMCLTNFEIFSKVKYMDEQIWKQAVNRGVRFKFLICGRTRKEIEQALDPFLKNSEHFKIEALADAPPTCVILIDDKEVFCRMGVTLESPVLWSTSSNFVAMMKDYLETKWKLLEHKCA
ncbi:MAG: helix-turn-helix domain-containing protein [Candidatus Bathyarchaeia archaeon]